MSGERKARIAKLETELQELKVQEQADRRAAVKARVEVLFQGLHLSDVELVREFVNEHARHLHALEGDDDE